MKNYKRIKPLLAWEDRQRATWFLIGAGLTLLIYLIV